MQASISTWYLLSSITISDIPESISSQALQPLLSPVFFPPPSSMPSLLLSTPAPWTPVPPSPSYSRSCSLPPLRPLPPVISPLPRCLVPWTWSCTPPRSPAPRLPEILCSIYMFTNPLQDLYFHLSLFLLLSGVNKGFILDLSTSSSITFSISITINLSLSWYHKGLGYYKSFVSFCLNLLFVFIV